MSLLVLRLRIHNSASAMLARGIRTAGPYAGPLVLVLTAAMRDPSITATSRELIAGTTDGATAAGAAATAAATGGAAAGAAAG
jgi:hypothetical protein